MKKLTLFCGILVLATLLVTCNHERIEPATPVDTDGNLYDTVRIGNQTWMKQDLKVLHLPNGMELQTFDIRLKEPAYTIYGNKVLYNSMAAQFGADSTSSRVRGICPKGWHLPSSTEWRQLTDYVSNHPELWDIAGTVSHALADQNWGKTTRVNDNQTGFSALPTGYVFSYDSHSNIGDARWSEREKAYYWCSDHNDYYPRPYNAPPPLPWTLPQWGVYGADSLEVQSFVCLMDINQEKPVISSLPDIHYCAIRCVKDE